MKKNTLILLLSLLIAVHGFSQEIINDLNPTTNGAIQQISTSGFGNILGFQTLDQDISNFVQTQQVGDQNKASIYQRRGSGSTSANQSYTFQQGNANELSVGQIGGGNLLLSFQLGYLASKLMDNQDNQFGLETIGEKASSFNINNGMPANGKRNKLEVSQTGNNNGIMAVQQGDDNSISAGQNGNNNYLVILQQGNKNSVTGYEQENSTEKTLFDTVIQKGESLSLSASDVSKSKPNGNIFSQSGINLSLQVNNGFVNALGGIEIAQTGHDMKVVVDQSYFSLPMK